MVLITLYNNRVNRKSMNLPARYVVAFVLLIGAMFGWNAFLIVRDNKMFEGYEQQHRAQVCAQMKSFHPDCQSVQ